MSTMVLASGRVFAQEVDGPVLVGVAAVEAVAGWLTDELGDGVVERVEVQDRQILIQLKDGVNAYVATRDLDVVQGITTGGMQVWTGTVLGCKVMIWQTYPTTGN